MLDNWCKKRNISIIGLRMYLVAIVCGVFPIVLGHALTGDEDNPFCLCEIPIPNDQNECGIAGVWRNQLKSVMKFTCVGGHIDGQYFTAVGKADGFYQLSGKYLKPDNDTTLLSWIVAYRNELYGNSNSTVAWSGIHYADEGTLYTHWLLTHFYPRPRLWKTTMINHDDFQKVC
ncbi:streptavidin-V2-like [Dreissena polymorpha]|uniref:Uncharacterized protein n=1 Tax=Dreissena polymorpha TaxID=45954 RepID=A0A9D4RTL1_DREPO|nr:streptavidin-V2-like [Dreissena polymorpha]XP_052273984.1 streptavidin-V2-like [Dreissena polymorpha]KAH3878147.1 hypothetical protein DPMN_002032 [Dreissena polymorpha]